MDLKYQVTQKDIDEGIRKDCENCPHAIALGRLFNGVHVTASHIRLNTNAHVDEWVSIDTTAEVLSWTGAFDQGHPVEPGTFVSPLPDDFPMSIFHASPTEQELAEL